MVVTLPCSLQLQIKKREMLTQPSHQHLQVKMLPDSVTSRWRKGQTCAQFLPREGSSRPGTQVTAMATPSPSLSSVTTCWTKGTTWLLAAKSNWAVCPEVPKTTAFHEVARSELLTSVNDISFKKFTFLTSTFYFSKLKRSTEMT